jgi:glyoxylase-like metal-dependent hydrolase (beta-lactamase superfamily II)
MNGAMTITRRADIKVHTHTAPEDGWLVNSHIIELATQSIVVDAQYTLPYARQVIQYASTLNKPVSRLYVTHYHPDHLLGAAAFAMPIHALAEVKAKIEAVGDRVASEEREKFPDAIPSHAEKPSLIVTPGEEMIDGVHFEFILSQHAETEDALIIGFPDHELLITQDLTYNNVHVFLGERAFDSWIIALAKYQALPYRHILPGHGAPAGPELYGTMRHYLTNAPDLLSHSANALDFRARLIAAFPNHGGRVLIDHQQRFLFPPQKEANA